MSKTVHLHQQQLADRLSVATGTLERWRWQGVGPKFIKVGGRVRYRIEDVEEYERSRLCTSTSDQYYFADKPSRK